MPNIGDEVSANGDRRVLAAGTTSDGATYVHLASLTRSVRQKNGARPVQACGWLRGHTLSNEP